MRINRDWSHLICRSDPLDITNSLNIFITVLWALWLRRELLVKESLAFKSELFPAVLLLELLLVEGKFSSVIALSNVLLVCELLVCLRTIELPAFKWKELKVASFRVRKILM